MPAHKYDQPVQFDGIATQIDVDVSQYIPDARVAIWTLYDTNGEELIGYVSIIDAFTVRVDSGATILPAGNYPLLGVA